MSNDPADRHVVAAAVHSRSQSIITYNRRHFPDAALRPLAVVARGPSTFLRDLYLVDPELFIQKIHEQAKAIGVTLQWVLKSLSRNVPNFVQYFCEEQGIDLAV